MSASRSATLIATTCGHGGGPTQRASASRTPAGVSVTSRASVRLAAPASPHHAAILATAARVAASRHADMDRVSMAAPRGQSAWVIRGARSATRLLRSLFVRVWTCLMPGPAPKLYRRRRNTPAGGEWQHAPAEGWRWGPVPNPPEGLTEASNEAWRQWFSGWVSAFWSPSDVYVLQIVVRLYDRCERGVAKATEWRELTAWLNGYGLTPKGRQQRRWLPPVAEGMGSAQD
jgi:hypothetical protein